MSGHETHEAADGHAAHLAHHFESLDQQRQSARLGMWIFIATEVLFFGGLLCAYSVYRANHPEIFVWAHHFLDKTLGAINTLILICSSLTAAWAVRAAQLRQRRVLILMLGLTLLFAFGFLGIKYTEYSHKWRHGLLWASRFDPHIEDEHGSADAVVRDADDAGQDSVAPEGGVAGSPSVEGADNALADVAEEPSKPAEISAIPPAAIGPPGLAPDRAPVVAAGQQLDAPRNARVFFSIYFLLTGLHGIHVLGGMGAMIWLLLRARRGELTSGNYTPVDMVALYWHLVDLIWIYLFLLLYLIH